MILYIHILLLAIYYAYTWYLSSTAALTKSQHYQHATFSSFIINPPCQWCVVQGGAVSLNSTRQPCELVIITCYVCASLELGAALVPPLPPSLPPQAYHTQKELPQAYPIPQAYHTYKQLGIPHTTRIPYPQAIRHTPYHTHTIPTTTIAATVHNIQLSEVQQGRRQAAVPSGGNNAWLFSTRLP
jgi:hypothetical protein